jgi:hypothetical protein
MEAEEIYETLVLSSALTWVIAQENFSTLIRRESFKLYITIFKLVDSETNKNQCLIQPIGEVE